MTVNSTLKSVKTANANNIPKDSRFDLSFMEFNYLKELLEEHIRRKNACKTMASNLYTQELINVWKDEIAQDVLLLQKLNIVINNCNGND